MPNKMERFTQRARRVLSLAQEAAEREPHPSINTGHILIGLMREDQGVAALVLTRMGASLSGITDAVNDLTGEVRSPDTRLELGADTKKMLELAVDEARRMGHNYIGTEHLLLGICRQSDEIGIQTLERIGLSAATIREEIRQTLLERPSQYESETQPSILATHRLRLVIQTKDGDPQAEIKLSPQNINQLVQAIGMALNAQQAGELMTVVGDAGQKIVLYLDAPQSDDDTEGDES